MIKIEERGSTKKTEAFLKRVLDFDISGVLHQYGRVGVEALSRATPVESGLAARSWRYTVESRANQYSITWHNDDIENGFPVVIRLQYGYATGTGGYVAGRDFINPAIKPIFDQIEEAVWKAVTSA